jgi:hypothetical protein
MLIMQKISLSLDSLLSFSQGLSGSITTCKQLCVLCGAPGWNMHVTLEDTADVAPDTLSDIFVSFLLCFKIKIQVHYGMLSATMNKSEAGQEDAAAGSRERTSFSS